jgi:hypothetical protein
MGDGRGLADWVRDRFDPVLLILSPPRCGSTALARSFWQHPAFRWYVHEPYDRAYHRGEGAESVLAALSQPLTTTSGARGIVLKEMTFQASGHLGELLGTTTLPVVICLRDPRQAVLSRMLQRAKAGLDPVFPQAESGWPGLQVALDLASANDIPHVLVDMTAVRQEPAILLPVLCDRLGLAYSPTMLSWPSRRDIVLGQLGHEQRHWYERVLTSTGFAPPDEEIPPLEAFPDSLREHVDNSLTVYRRLLADQRTLTRRHTP